MAKKVEFAGQQVKKQKKHEEKRKPTYKVSECLLSRPMGKGSGTYLYLVGVLYSSYT